jgi:hypothetical protein
MRITKPLPGNRELWDRAGDVAVVGIPDREAGKRALATWPVWTRQCQFK